MPEDLRTVEPGGEYEPLSDPSGEHVESVTLTEVDAAPEPSEEPAEPWRIKLPGEPGADEVDPADTEDPDASSDATEPDEGDGQADEPESEVPF